MKTEMNSKLRSGAQALGTWLSIGSPVIAEIAVEVGFDWLLFDLEHGCDSEAGLMGNLRATRRSQTAAIVRVGAPHPDLVSRVLDWGADGIMFPQVNDVDVAKACVRTVAYPPEGTRGMCRSSRTYSYGLSAPEPDVEPPKPFILLQIETLAGVRNAREIAAVAGVDALFIGPADLAFDLRQRKESELDFQACVDRVASAASDAGKQWGTLIRTTADVPTWQERGGRILAVDSDIGILRRRYSDLLKSVSADR